MNAITNNIFQKVVKIETCNSVATSFTMENSKGEQFLITAKHVFNKILNGDECEIFIHHTSSKENIKVQVYFPSDRQDIAILKLLNKDFVTPVYPLSIFETITVSQEAFFLGFPYGHVVDCPSDFNNDYPLPLVKKAIFSTPVLQDGSIFLDGHNNPGFSGGPVVALNLKRGQFELVGVISGYRYEQKN